MKTLNIFILLTLVLISFNRILAQEKTGNPINQYVTHITGKIDDSFKHDTILLQLNGPVKHFGGKTVLSEPQILTTTADKQGVFKFKVLTGNSPFHISLFLSSKGDMSASLGTGEINDYLIEPADSINIVFNKEMQFYSGKGADLFDAQSKVESIDKGNRVLTWDTYDIYRNNKEKWLMQKDSLLGIQLSLLNTFQSKLSPMAYRIVRADIIGVNRAWIYRRIDFEGFFSRAGIPLKKDLANLWNELNRRPAYVESGDRTSLSPKYINYLYEKLRIEVKYARNLNNINPLLDDNYFPEINKQYTGILRDKLLAYWLTSIASINHLQPEYITNALSVMQTPVFIKMVEKLNSAFAKGQPVTDFEFKDVNDKIVHLDDLKGKVLLLDVWFSGCAPCVDVAEGLPHVEEVFKNRSDVLFVSISVDKDKKVWLKSIDKNSTAKYNYYTTSTTKYLYTGGTATNHPFIKKYVSSGSFPLLLIIDKEGKMFSSTPSRPTTEQGRESLINVINEALRQ